MLDISVSTLLEVILDNDKNDKNIIFLKIFTTFPETSRRKNSCFNGNEMDSGSIRFKAWRSMPGIRFDWTIRISPGL